MRGAIEAWHGARRHRHRVERPSCVVGEHPAGPLAARLVPVPVECELVSCRHDFADELRVSQRLFAGDEEHRGRAGDVILLHDADHYGARASWRATAAALPDIVDRIAAAGLRATSVRIGPTPDEIALAL